ncbi:J domain-containing protein [Halanaerobium hydrogeniformans]|uniref:Heat shock protein DnaJ domain protein n=1 Tax=Halanaerobium hydrogeniformans TaxID=656519 RepID=E4RNC7_HALHG|nr:J domain-containing protein [Halanaerobium hydrogeniformans]ADQ13595.1 heat shock protein DnaJ domain protein [Halanaerobium hydrogeniformans]
MNDDQLTPENIIKAAEILKLKNKESMLEIKNKYRSLAKKWHPDTCQKKQKVCEEKIREISWAYNIIKNYCDKYLYDFKKGEIIDNLPRDIQAQEKLKRQFKNGPLWS